jgi:hypothetical protein
VAQRSTDGHPKVLEPALESMTLLVAVIVHDEATNRVVLLQRGHNAKFAQGMWDLPVGTTAAEGVLSDEPLVSLVRAGVSVSTRSARRATRAQRGPSRLSRSAELGNCAGGVLRTRLRWEACAREICVCREMVTASCRLRALL